MGGIVDHIEAWTITELRKKTRAWVLVLRTYITIATRLILALENQWQL